MNIRRAEEKDIPVMAMLSKKLGYSSDETLLKERFTFITSNSNHVIFVAEDEKGTVIGWIHLLPRVLLISELRAEIGGLIVDEGCRRKGIGKKLIEEAEYWAIKNGYEGIVVRSNTKREESHNFYPAVGYDFLKEQRVYGKTIKKR